MPRKPAPQPITDLQSALLALAAEWKHAAKDEQFGGISCTLRECADELLDVLKRAGRPPKSEPEAPPRHFLEDIEDVRIELLNHPKRAAASVNRPDRAPDGVQPVLLGA